MLIALHLGLHTHVFQKRLWTGLRDSFFAYAYVFLYFLTLAAGAWCFTVSGLWRTLFALPAAGRFFSVPAFYLQRTLITIMACQLMHLALSAGDRRQKNRKD